MRFLEFIESKKHLPLFPFTFPLLPYHLLKKQSETTTSNNISKKIKKYINQAGKHHYNLDAMDESDDYPKECNTQDGREVMSSSSTTSVHVTALDGLVNVNSLFTIAVFVGLSLATPGQRSLENRTSCDAGIDVTKKLLVFEVVSFSFFLFSSLVAQGLKLAINLLNCKNVEDAFRAHINLKVLRFGMLGSAFGSVMGCVFLVLSMVNVIQIRLGMLSCGSKSAVHAVVALVVLVTTALLVYISTAVYAFLH